LLISPSTVFEAKTVTGETSGSVQICAIDRDHVALAGSNWTPNPEERKSARPEPGLILPVELVERRRARIASPVRVFADIDRLKPSALELVGERRARVVDRPPSSGASAIRIFRVADEPAQKRSPGRKATGTIDAAEKISTQQTMQDEFS